MPPKARGTSLRWTCTRRPGLAHALETRDSGLPAVVVAQTEPQHVLGLALHDLDVDQVALSLENLGDRHFGLRRRQLDLRVTHHLGVPYPSEHIGDRVRHRHACAPPTSLPCERRASTRGAPAAGNRCGRCPRSGCRPEGARSAGTGFMARTLKAGVRFHFSILLFFAIWLLPRSAELHGLRPALCLADCPERQARRR